MISLSISGYDNFISALLRVAKLIRQQMRWRTNVLR